MAPIPIIEKKKRSRRYGFLIKPVIYVAFPVGTDPFESVNFMSIDYVNPALVTTSTISRFQQQTNEKVLGLPPTPFDPYNTQYNIYRYTTVNQLARNLVGLGSVDTSVKK